MSKNNLPACPRSPNERVFVGKALVAAFLTLAMLVPLGASAMNDWTIIVYISNDDHDPEIGAVNRRHIEGMERIQAGERIEVAIQVDESPEEEGYKGASRLSIKNGARKDEGKLGEINMGSPYALWDCLKWAVKEHPARNYFLIFNSHGSGVFSWRGTGATGSSRPGAVSFDPSRFVAYDDTDDDCLTVFEIQAVLQAFAERLNAGRKVAILGFDACLPGTIEVLYQFREIADFLIGTPDETSITGFRYPAILEELARNPKVGAASFAGAALSKFTQKTMCAWKLKKVQEIVFNLNNLAMEILKAQEEKGRKFTIDGMVEYGGDERYWDLFKMVHAVAGGRTSLKQAANFQLIKNLAAEVEESLTAAMVNPDKGSLSIALPNPKEYEEFQKFYKALDFAKSTKWDEVLDLRQLGQK